MSEPLLPDAAEREAALDLAHHVLVMAPAGSGKTGLLVSRLLLALATCEEPEQVVAITFTNKAAAEIRHRALQLLRDAADGQARGHTPAAFAAAGRLLAHERAHDWRLLEQPERLRALTIDAFNAQLAGQLPLLSGLGGPMRTSDDAESLYGEAVLRLFAELERDDLPAADREALEHVLRLAGNRIDALLRPLAELLSRREQWLPAVARRYDDAAWDQAERAQLHALVESALREFCDALGPAHCRELCELLRLGSTQGEPLSWCADLEAWPEAAARELPRLRRLAAVLVTQDGSLRSPKGINVRTGFKSGLPHTQRMKKLLEAVAGDTRLQAACRRVLELPEAEYPAGLKQFQRALLRVMQRLAAHLRVVFGERGQADYAQIALSALAALRPTGDTVGDALLAADRRIRHLLVDEMQDTSEAQVELLRQLTAGWEPGDGRSLFLVGDPQQSIYAFRKAEVRLFLRMWNDGRLGELPLTCLRLSANFRSSARIVGWFNHAFGAIFPGQVDADLGSVPFAPSAPQRAPGEGRVDVACFADGDADGAAQAAAARAAELAAAGGSVAVLGRARTHLAPVIRALRARGLTPACQDIDPLETQPAVRDIVALARALWHPADRLHWAVLLRAPFVGLSWADLVALSVGRLRRSWPERIGAVLRCPLADIETLSPKLSPEGRARLQRLQDVLDATAREQSLRASLADRTEAVWTALGGPACVTPDALADVQAALRLLRAQQRGGGIEDVETFERALAQLYSEPRAGQVQVMTVHKSKGLEFDHVLLVACHRRPRGEDAPLWHLKRIGDEELLVPRPPDAFAQDDPAHRLYDFVHSRHLSERRNEALRLLYVAVTRARESLTLYLEPKAGSGSFAELLAPVIAEPQAPSATEAAADERQEQDAAAIAQPPRAPRLPADLRLPPDALDAALYRPQERRTLKPSEAVLNAVEEKREWSAESTVGDLYAQLVGTLFHQALERVAQEGLAAWADGGASRAQSLGAGFRRLGLPEPQVGPAVARVLELLGRSLQSPVARWLLSAGDKRWSRSEYHLAGYRQGRWVAAVLDRCFEDADGRLWIVDYKTAARPLAPEAIEAYVAQGVEKYRAQIAEYVALLGALHPGREIRGALYFVEADRLEVV